MRPDQKDKAALQKREMEIRRLIRQMELDQLHQSTVFKNLGQELNSVMHELMMQGGDKPTR
jgi:hypothetical protein